jgi:hypothetical protein
MFTKILFTVLIIAGILLYVRRQEPKRSAEPTTQVSSRSSPQTLPRTSSRLPLIAAYTAIVLTLAIGGLLYYLDWKEDHRIMTIRVINTSTGEIGSYRAYQSMIRGRSFVTLDGRTITVSNAERVEISEAELR